MAKQSLDDAGRQVPVGRGSARARLLTAAAECFYDRGVNATGIDTITAVAGVAKMSLYNNFASKDELVMAYLAARHEEWLQLYRTRLGSGGDARSGIAAVFGAYIDHADMAYQHGFRGCGLLNAAAELPAGAPGRDLVRSHKEDVQALLAGHLADLGILPGDQVEQLAEQLSFLLEGAMSRAGLEGNNTLLQHARDLAIHIVNTAAGASR